MACSGVSCVHRSKRWHCKLALVHQANVCDLNLRGHARVGKERQDGLHTFFHHNFKASILNLEVRSQDAKIPFSSELCPVEGATSVSLYAYNQTSNRQ